MDTGTEKFYNTISWQFVTVLRFSKLLANSYEFIQSYMSVFVRSAYAPVMVMFRGWVRGGPSRFISICMIRMNLPPHKIVHFPLRLTQI